MAGRYTHGHHESVLRSHSWRTAENSAAYLLPELRVGQSLLDVGCGPGTITVDLARRLAPGSVVGVDADAGIVAAAAAAPDAAAIDTLAFAVADVYDLDVAALGGPFDVVHAHQVLQHLGDPVAALRSMAAATRPGGLVAARDSDYSAMTWYPRPPAMDEWMVLMQRISRLNGGEPDAGRRMLSWALAAGFREVTPSAAVWCFATPGQRQWWGGLWAERATASAVATQARELGLADDADLARIAAGWHEWADAEDGWLAILMGEIRCRVAG